MRCDYGGEVTFTTCEPDYRLRIDVGPTVVSIILSTEDVKRLQDRIRSVLEEEDGKG